MTRVSQSSTFSEAMLAAMRPDDLRYAALALPVKAAVDATVRCVVLCWPVIDAIEKIIEFVHREIP